MGCEKPAQADAEWVRRQSWEFWRQSAVKQNLQAAFAQAVLFSTENLDTVTLSSCE